MKIKTKEPEFNPIEIVIESQEELYEIVIESQEELYALSRIVLKAHANVEVGDSAVNEMCETLVIGLGL